jgi:hypothetical protein
MLVHAEQRVEAAARLNSCVDKRNAPAPAIPPVTAAPSAVASNAAAKAPLY